VKDRLSPIPQKQTRLFINWAMGAGDVAQWNMLTWHAQGPGFKPQHLKKKKKILDDKKLHLTHQSPQQN
jgi:hypothetical protein